MFCLTASNKEILYITSKNFFTSQIGIFMKTEEKNGDVYSKIEEYSTFFDYTQKEIAIILAAGHGKRIKSQRSKMLHKIWEVPTVERVYNACKEGIPKINLLIVVGIKATDVIEVIGNREQTQFAYQKEQHGTGHAVQVAMEKIDSSTFDGIVYVLPGDMGLINQKTMEMFRKDFLNSASDMMVLTGRYEGNPIYNNYGRIVRVKDKDINGNLSGDDVNRVIEIIEYKDILKLNDKEPYLLDYNKKTYSYTKEELIQNNEFNSGVYAFKYKQLEALINTITSNNAQNEIYITDLISIFNKNGYKVGAVSPEEQHVLMGFNNKSVLREMEAVAREHVYHQLKDIIDIADPEDFFIHESVVADILKLDELNIPLDIRIGKGVYIGKGVKLNYDIELKKNVVVKGNVHFGQKVVIWENVLLSCYENQTFQIGNNVEILWGDIIKGNIEIKNNTKIESSVNMTGSDEYPLRIGSDVLIKGTSYIFGSIIDDGVHIEHSVIIKKHVNRLVKKDGTIQTVKFYLPMPMGVDAIEERK